MKSVYGLVLGESRKYICLECSSFMKMYVCDGKKSSSKGKAEEYVQGTPIKYRLTFQQKPLKAYPLQQAQKKILTKINIHL